MGTEAAALAWGAAIGKCGKELEDKIKSIGRSQERGHSEVMSKAESLRMRPYSCQAHQVAGDGLPTACVRSGKFMCRQCEGGASRCKPREPSPAEPISKTAQTGNQPGGDVEFGSEAGDCFEPCFRIGADPQQEWREIGIDGSLFVRSH